MNDITDEELRKSIDELITDIFPVEQEDKVEKMACEEALKPDTTADSAVSGVSPDEDDKKKKDRPKEQTEISQTQGKDPQNKQYDDATTEAAPAPELVEHASQTKVPTELVKKSITQAEYEEYQALKKAKQEAKQAEAVKKAEEAQEKLIKSVLDPIKEELEADKAKLEKSLAEMQETLNAIANKPQPRKSIDSVAALEKSQRTQSQQFFTKDEMLDAAEVLAKSNANFTDDDVMELENTGDLFDINKKRLLEAFLAKQ